LDGRKCGRRLHETIEGDQGVLSTNVGLNSSVLYIWAELNIVLVNSVKHVAKLDDNKKIQYYIVREPI